MIGILSKYGHLILIGFKNTLLSSIIALFFSILLGGTMGIFQTTNSKFLRGIGNIYVEFFRNIPLLVIAMTLYVAMPFFGVDISGFWAGTIALILYTSAFIADVVRSGIESIPEGQKEAGLSTGLTENQVMRYIILPQAIRVVIPPLGNQFINLVKNSSILAMVAGLDLMYYGDLIASETFKTVDTYVLIALFYLVITLPLTYLMQHLERRLEERYA